MTTTIAEQADVDPTATIGVGSRVWHLAQIREDAQVGRNVVIGRGAYIGTGVVVGDNCKIQNHALVYEPAELGAGVFIGPAAVLTNDQYPRAINADGTPKSASDWTPVGVRIGEGAAIGARAVCVAPLQIGRWALVAAGATVIHDVPDYALVAGVPAKRVGWVGPAGHPLESREDRQWQCPATGDRFVQEGESLVPVNLASANRPGNDQH